MVAGGASGAPTAIAELRGSDGRILVVGGEGPGGVLRNTAELFE